MDISNIQGLKNLSVLEVSGILKYEHPQAIALILSYQESDFAAKILSSFTERLRNDVLLRITTLGPVHAFWLNVLDNSIQSSIGEQSSNRIVEVNGFTKSVQLMEHLEDWILNKSIDYLREYDPDLIQDILDASDVLKDR